MAVDDQLLNQSSQSEDSEEENKDSIDRMADFNSGQQQARLKKKQEKAEEKKKKSIKPKKLNSLQTTIAGITRSSWLNMLPFYFLPIIWVDIHWLGGYLGFKKMFVKLGGEWFARPGVNSKEVDRLGTSLNLPESVGCACFNFGCFIILLIILALITIIYCSMNIECALQVALKLIQAAWDKIQSFF